MKNKCLVVGLGQCGNKIAELFGKNGYVAIGVNTAQEDMKDLNNIEKLQIGSYGGSGKDRSLAIKQLKDDFNKIFSVVKEASVDKDFIILASSLGGGTGSGTVVATANNISKALQKTVIVAAVLPVDTEGANLKSNAMEAIGELNKIKDSVNIMLIKNSNDYSTVNHKVFKKIDCLFNVSGKTETSFDRMDLINSFANGYLDIAVGHGEEVELVSDIYDLSTASNINFVAMTKKRIKGDVILNDYNAFSKNFFDYKTTDKSSYFAIFSELAMPVGYMNKIKNDIKVAHERFIGSKEDEEFEFDLGIDLGFKKKKSVVETKKEETTTEHEFIFEF